MSASVIRFGAHCAVSAPPRRTGVDLRAALGTTWVALGGWPHPEVSDNFEIAWRLGGTLDRGNYTLRTLWGLAVYRLCLGRPREALTWARHILDFAAQRDSDRLRLVGHSVSASCHYFVGEFSEALGHCDEVLVLYDSIRGQRFFDLINHDPKTSALTFKACCQWVLGFPDQAALTADAAITHARALGHPFDLSHALHFIAIQMSCYGGDADLVQQLLDEFEHIAKDQRLSFYQDVMVPMCRAIRLAMVDCPENVAEAFAQSIPQWVAGRMGTDVPRLKAQCAESLAALGQINLALTMINEALEHIAEIGAQEKKDLAEILRVKAGVLLRYGDVGGAEALLKQGLEVSIRQKAKSWELRAAISLGRLWQSQGKRKEAYELLAPSTTGSARASIPRT